ncbi:hypothetical protein M378DRAFT_124358 [Amanita muscaria Koide BX008]|uniref:Fungal lipase-type domain-containing protein n=1 Tax=Amanita muscaria (strain Koide BX008) TaxID=946122 RepID=A0A0C2WWV5_AMAMK|nr:hypothetical protein M378DRAFT_124358 [Amanita muscaria Koide BX008]
MLYGELAFLLFTVALVQAAPYLLPRQTSPLSASQLAALDPYTQFARASYCPDPVLADWSCGEACSALSGFTPTLVGGDGNSVQIFFVGYWSDQNSVVVAHEGTDPTKFLSLLTDANIAMATLDPTLFPGVPSTVRVHDGFRHAQAQTAHQILAEVRRLMSAYKTTHLTLVGHSLGGAIAELDSLFFALNIPGVTIKAVTYGTPRVGNSEFAHLIDAHVPDFTRVNNKRDPIPIVPGRFLGFAHPSGEIHILPSGSAITCSGDDDATDAHCTDKFVPNIFVANILDHLGPYNGIPIGTLFCY